MSTIRTARHVTVTVCIASAILGCIPDRADGPSELGFPLVYVHDDCAPWDGAALSLVLAHEPVTHRFDVPYPSLAVTSYRPPSPPAGGSFEWRGEAPDVGHARWCDEPGECTAPVLVSVHFDRYQRSPDRLTGRLRIELEDGSVAAGRFEAERLPFRGLCG